MFKRCVTKGLGLASSDVHRQAGGRRAYQTFLRRGARLRRAVFSMVMAPYPMLALAGLALPVGVFAEDERANYFDDPFLQVTDGIPDCPKQEGPKITLTEMRAETHSRVERGTSCYQSGRCRLPNAYLYDKEIIPRVKKAILADGRFSDTSIWIEGQRRWVWLRGCGRQPGHISSLEQLVRNIDDVEAVINQLAVVRR